MDFSLAAIHRHWCKRNGGATGMVYGGWLNTGRLRRRTAYALPVPYSRTGYADVAVDASWPYVDAEWGCAKRSAQSTSSQVQLDAGYHLEALAETPTHYDSPLPIQFRTSIRVLMRPRRTAPTAPLRHCCSPQSSHCNRTDRTSISERWSRIASGSGKKSFVVEVVSADVTRFLWALSSSTPMRPEVAESLR